MHVFCLIFNIKTLRGKKKRLEKNKRKLECMAADRSDEATRDQERQRALTHWDRGAQVQGRIDVPLRSIHEKELNLSCNGSIWVSLSELSNRNRIGKNSDFSHVRKHFSRPSHRLCCTFAMSPTAIM